ncbi:MAG: CocE/NonD family hydrolase [Acidobacteria bacterium]|nr:CocE/NonD family hydrolase [Acidobacteriota bacterium]MBI3488376.1 CocE/NonD family hydrolase [Acidobacteriota bacterium]
MIRTCFAFLLVLAAQAQSFDTPPSLEAPALAALARQILRGTPPESQALREPELNARLCLQLQARDDAGALATATLLREWKRGPLEPNGSLNAPLHELFARTRLAEARGASPEAALEQAFSAMVKDQPGPRLYRLAWTLAGDPAAFDRRLKEQWEGLRTRPQLTREEALPLLRTAQLRDSLARVLPGAAALMAEEEARRYVVDDDVHITTPAGITLCATLVRPRTQAKLPTAFQFTIYANEYNHSEALHSASEGFVGLVANTRGKRHSRGPVEPYEHDGEDAAAVIDWIARQPWSDGRVGMYGGSYEGFTQWAAAKHRPKALVSIMPSVAVAPGIDVPMEGGVFQSFVYRWIPYVSKLPGLDEAGYGDRKHWNGLDATWFQSGRPYRELDAIDGTPNPIWRRWLEHPTYDRYWQRMTASEGDFARIDIPVLSTTGYFDGCLISALHYFNEHLAQRPDARHYFLVGPYNHVGAQRQSADVFGGYRIDPSARIDIVALRYQWLDHTLRGGPRPEPLKDRLNYQVMGADQWKHASSVAAMAKERLVFHLEGDPTGAHRLVPAASGKRAAKRGRGAELLVDLAERKTENGGQPELIEAKEMDASNCIAFTSEPLAAPLEVSGLFEGSLALTTNKKDFDLNLQLYERLADGRCFLLSYFIGRASQIRDRHRRQLLAPGKELHLPFRSGRLVSRRLSAGSRLVLLVGIIKQAGAQVNYGTGKDVSDESMKDAGAWLSIRLSPASTLVLPVNR